MDRYSTIALVFFIDLLGPPFIINCTLKKKKNDLTRVSNTNFQCKWPTTQNYCIKKKIISEIIMGNK